ncbi:hypothetical protein [Mycolicibacterium lacusdiani]|nr:hypothetical protein [Mycolicibacterium lacusdiani]
MARTELGAVHLEPEARQRGERRIGIQGDDGVGVAGSPRLDVAS